MNARRGDLLQHVTTGIILQQVNAQGVMGSGIAQQIRSRWPVVFETYSSIILPNQPATVTQGYLGKLIMVEVEPDLVVANVVGQQYYGREPGRCYTSYEALATGLQQLRSWMDDRLLMSSDVHHPLIGAGLGGGDWAVISRLIQENLGTETTLWRIG